jgi:D-3-phosphoglycerate dehydrogenase / 2-oxoglutarate reductase
MRLLIADKLHPRAIEELRALPITVEYEPDLTSESLEQKLPGVGILIVRSTEVTAKAIENATALNLIVRAGASYATIDTRAASRRGIYVANCPGKNAAAVAELVFGLLVSVDRRIVDGMLALRSGEWLRAEYGKAEGLYGKTLGIAGLGAIGREVAVRAKAFGMHVVAFSKSLTPARATDLGIGYSPNMEDLAHRSQVLSLHMALTERTKKIVNERVLSALCEHAILINTARAELIDQDALREAVQKRRLRVALDVVGDEPRGTTRYPVGATMFGPASAERGFVYGTPHIAASTDQAQLAIATEAVRVVRSFLLEGEVPNVINVLSSSVAKFQVVIRMLDKVGTFANVLNVIKRHGINVEEVTNTIFEGGGAACAKLRVLSRPSEACLREIRAFEEVLHVDVVTLPNLA